VASGGHEPPRPGVGQGGRITATGNAGALPEHTDKVAQQHRNAQDM